VVVDGELRARATRYAVPAVATLLAAIAEDGLVTKVTRGENAGKTLNEDAVTRAMIKAKPAECVDVTLRVPAGIKPERLRLVIYAQDEKSGKVLAVAEQQLQAS